MQTAVTNMTKKRMLYKTLINDLTFRMPQHISSEVTVGYNTIRFKFTYSAFWLFSHFQFVYTSISCIYILVFKALGLEAEILRFKFFLTRERFFYE